MRERPTTEGTCDKCKVVFVIYPGDERRADCYCGGRIHWHERAPAPMTGDAVPEVRK